MRRYFILTPPNGPDRNHDETIIMADRFSWLAFLFPWIWLGWHRLWLLAGTSLVLQIASIVLMTVPGFFPGGVLLGLAVSLLAGLEARNRYCETLVRQGWTLERVLFAPSLSTAEDIYFSSLPAPQTTSLPDRHQWAISPTAAQPASPQGAGFGLGLFDYGAR